MYKFMPYTFDAKCIELYVNYSISKCSITPVLHHACESTKIIDLLNILHVILDIPNCMINDHNCTQICVELEGSFNCSCYSGYQLQQDRVTCEGN